MHAITIYSTNNESMMNIHEHTEKWIHMICMFQLYQLYDKEYFWTLNIMKNIFEYNTILFIS